MFGYLPIYIFMIALSTIVSFRVYTSAFSAYPYLRYFPPFLIATLFVESFGVYLSSRNKSNIVYYNFFTIVEFFFYLWIISCMINSIRARRITRCVAYGYVLVAVANILYGQGMSTFHSVTYALGCLTVVAVSIYYFLELFREPKPTSLLNSPPFWICSGLLFFYCCGFPLYAFINFWATLSWVINSFTTILITLNTFLYALFTIAFLCVRTPKYTQLSS